MKFFGIAFIVSGLLFGIQAAGLANIPKPGMDLEGLKAGTSIGVLAIVVLIMGAVLYAVGRRLENSLGGQIGDWICGAICIAWSGLIYSVSLYSRTFERDPIGDKGSWSFGVIFAIMLLAGGLYCMKLGNTLLGKSINVICGALWLGMSAGVFLYSFIEMFRDGGQIRILLGSLFALPLLFAGIGFIFGGGSPKNPPVQSSENTEQPAN